MGIGLKTTNWLKPLKMKKGFISVSSPKRILWRVSYGILMLPLICCTAYIAYWCIAASLIEKYWPKLQPLLQANGFKAIMPPTITVKGFPYSFTMVIPDINIAYFDTPNPWSLKADSIKLIATAWRPIDVKLIIRNARQDITVNGQRPLVSANATIFSYLGFDGKLKSAEIHATDIALSAQAGQATPSVTIKEGQIILTHFPNQPEWLVISQFQVISLPGVSTPFLSGPIPIVILYASAKGPWQGKNFLEKLVNWQKSAGKILIENLLVLTQKWSVVANQVAIQLDEQLQPQSDVYFQLYGYDNLLQSFFQVGSWDEETQNRIQDTSELLAAAQGNLDNSFIAVKLSIENQIISWGPITLYHLQRIDWFYFLSLFPTKIFL